MARMKILNAVEQEAFESPPVFNSVQRKQHFDFPFALRHLAASLHTPTHQLCFLLSSAYFKATKGFFAPEDFRPRDIEYVAAQLNFSENNFDFADYSDRTRQRHQPVILKFYGFRADPFAAQTEAHFVALCRRTDPGESRGTEPLPPKRADSQRDQ